MHLPVGCIGCCTLNAFMPHKKIECFGDCCGHISEDLAWWPKKKQWLRGQAGRFRSVSARGSVLLNKLWCASLATQSSNFGAELPLLLPQVATHLVSPLSSQESHCPSSHAMIAYRNVFNRELKCATLDPLVGSNTLNGRSVKERHGMRTEGSSARGHRTISSTSNNLPIRSIQCAAVVLVMSVEMKGYWFRCFILLARWPQCFLSPNGCWMTVVVHSMLSSSGLPRPHLFHFSWQKTKRIESIKRRRRGGLCLMSPATVALQRRLIRTREKIGLWHLVIRSGRDPK